MKKIIRYILLLLLVSNVCQGQQFVNGNFNTNRSSWLTTRTPEWFLNAVDLTPEYESGNGANLIQEVSFQEAGCFTITFRLGTYNDGAAPQFHTAGVRVSMSIGNNTTQIGHVTMTNTGGDLGWQTMSVGPFNVSPGNIRFTFTGDNGFATTGRVMMIDDITLVPCNCQCGQWSSTANYNFSMPGNPPVSGSVIAGETVIIPREASYEILPSFNCTGVCNTPAYIYTVYNPDGSVLFPSSANFWWATNAVQMQNCSGKYKIEIRANCNQQNCADVFTFYVQRSCPCDCPPLPDVYYNTGADLTRAEKIDCSKNSIIKIKCQQQVNIQAFANCQGDGCTSSKVSISVDGPGINFTTAEDENALAFFAMQKGDYVVTTTSTCNNKSCTPCKVTFRVEECNCPPPLCCKTPMEVRLNKEEIRFQYAAETRVTIPFSLNGAGKKFTQVRASLVGFDLYSDNETCMDCYNDSKNWGSIYIGSIGGFTPSYTGQNLGAHSNVREVVFNSPAALVVNSTQLNLGFVLPQAQTLDCCKVYADLYIKITYRDNDCNECDTIIPVRVSLVRTKNGKPVEINLPDSPLRNARGSKAKIKSTNSL